MSAAVRGAVAGAVAATAWSAVEPIASRALGTRYSDVRLLGRLASERHWVTVGTAIHAANGAAFGAAFALLGRGGVRDAVAWTGAETLATWPGMALMDRIHPDRRSGHWPRPLVTDGRVFVQEVLMHGLFGVVLGLMTRRPPGR